MRQTLRSISLLLLAAVWSASAVAGQQGVRAPWASLGIGYGSAKAICDQCEGQPRVGGVSGFARIGTSLDPNVSLGAEYHKLFRDNGEMALRASGVDLIGQWHASPEGGVYGQLGVGLAFLTADFRVSPTETVSGEPNTGFDMSIGVGYEFPVSPHFRLAPFAGWYLGWMGTVKGPNGLESADKVVASTLHAGLVLTAR